MDNALIVDDIALDRRSYGGDLRILNSVLSATGFDQINFTPININRPTNSAPVMRRRKGTKDQCVQTQTQAFVCDLCKLSFPLKKTRDRHRDSVHKQQSFPCSACSRVFNRKDIRNRHKAEKHSGRRRSRTLFSITSLDLDTSAISECNTQALAYSNKSVLGDVFDSTSPSMEMGIDQSVDAEHFDRDDTETVTIESMAIHDCVGLIWFGTIETGSISNPLLLCTNLLIRCKPYERFQIHEKRREIVAQRKWDEPDERFRKLYDSAIRTLSFRLSSGSRDPEFLAAMAAFANVDVLICGSKRMGLHARAMYSMKAHHGSRRDTIFEALKNAFEHCGQTCESIRFIYTKHGFVWMLNTGYRCLMIPID